MRLKLPGWVWQTFPGDKELLLLQGKAEIQDKKLQTRKAIEQRIRDIKVKINREKFSEAIELAKQTLVTLGPNTAVTQLLSSAQVEFETGEKKRKQEREIESIRLLVERGDFEQAALTLDEALATQALETYDPRVLRVLDEIGLARSKTSAPTPSDEPHDPGLSKEYAWSGPPPIDPADVSDSPTQAQIAAPRSIRNPAASVGQFGSPAPSRGGSPACTGRRAGSAHRPETIRFGSCARLTSDRTPCL